MWAWFFLVLGIQNNKANDLTPFRYSWELQWGPQGGPKSANENLSVALYKWNDIIFPLHV